MAKQTKPPMFPADVVTATEPELPAGGVPAFPDMKNMQREMVEAEKPPEGDTRAVCVRKCLYRGKVYKPGDVGHFAGEVPPHFKG